MWKFDELITIYYDASKKHLSIFARLIIIPWKPQLLITLSQCPAKALQANREIGKNLHKYYKTIIPAMFAQRF